MAAPASPDLALQGVLAGHQNQLARDQELLLDGHRRLADAQAKFGTGMNGRFPAHLVSVVSDRAQISELSASLVNTARKDWMTLENLHTEMPLTEDFAQPPLPAFGGPGAAAGPSTRPRRWMIRSPGGSSSLRRGGGAGAAAAARCR